MSISDRLDQIEARADRATEGPWEAYSFPGDRAEAPYSAVDIGDREVRLEWLEGSGLDAMFIAHARADVPALLAALRAVLDLCEKTPLRYQTPLRDEPFMVLGTDVIRSEIAAALGEES